MADGGYLRLKPENGAYLGSEPATTARTPQVDPLADPAPGFGAGFVSSVVSGMGEMFGMPTLETAQRFRNENPTSGFISQLISPLPEYSAMYRLSKLPKFASALERGTVATARGLGIDAATAPVRAGMIREVLRFAPLEASRLAVGGLAFGAFDDNHVIDSDLFADVALSTVITGGIGGIGGYFRAGGRRGPQPSHVEGTDLRLTPTHQLDALMNDPSKVVGGMSADDFRVALREEILSERTAKGAVSQKPLPYITQLEGAGTADDVAAVNSLFGTRAVQSTSKGGLSTRMLTEGPESNFKNLNAGEQAAVVAELGFDNIDEVARNAMFPRLQTAHGANGARQLNSVLSRPGWTPIGERAFLAREPEGAFVIAKRLSKGNGKLQGIVHGNDRWFVAKTTNPGAFVPEAKALGDQTMASWARWRQLWQPAARNNVFDQNTDLMLKAMTPLDYHDLLRMNKGSWISEMTKRLAARSADAAAPGMRQAVRESKTLRDTAEWLYDTFKPTMFLEHQDARFGRLFGTMRNAVRVADNYATRIMQGKVVFKGTPSEALRGKRIDFESGFNGHRPVKQIANDLTPAEVNLVAHASAGSELPETALKELMESGQLSSKAVTAVQELQAINRSMLDELVLPAIRDLPQVADVKWLEGYLMPRIYKGDWRVEVKNEKGAVTFLAAGRNGKQAQAEAQAVIEEAKARGKNWTMAESRLRNIIDPDSNDLSQLQEQLVKRLATDPDEASVVYDAMRKLAVKRATTGRNPAVPTSASTLRPRTGRKGSPDVQTYTHEDLLSAIDGHTRTLLRFAGMQSWRERFGGIAYSWGQNNPTLYANLMRKAQQYLGIEGQITNTLNRALEPVLGGVLGKKAATKIAAATNEVMYNWNLALLNPTFAILNLLTPLQTVAPWIAMMTRAPSHEAGKMMQFVPIFDNAGRMRGSGSILSPMKVLGQATKMLRDPTDDLKVMLQQAMDDGVLSAQLYEEWVGRSARASQTLRGAFQEGGYLEFMRRGATYMAEKSESYSRMISFNSGYLVGKHHFGLEGDALYRFARRTTEVTMYQYGTVDRARIFTGPVGSVVGLFKNWQMHFLGNMINYAGLGWRTNTWSPLLWNVAAASALGGLGATPLKVMADGIARWNTDSPSAFQWMQENWHDSADEIYFGLPAFLGVSLQASSAIPGTDVRNEASSLGSVVIWKRMQAVGKALGDAWTVQTATGENALRDPNVRDKLLAALAPRALYRAASALEGDYVKSMSTGYPLARDISPSGKILHGLGMNMVEVERWQVAAKELWRDQEARRSAIEGLGISYADAMGNDDPDKMEQILLRAAAMKVPISSVIKSAKTRMRREAESDALSRFDKDLQARYRSALGPPAEQ